MEKKTYKKGLFRKEIVSILARMSPLFGKEKKMLFSTMLNGSIFLLASLGWQTQVREWVVKKNPQKALQILLKKLPKEKKGSKVKKDSKKKKESWNSWYFLTGYLFFQEKNWKQAIPFFQKIPSTSLFYEKSLYYLSLSYKKNKEHSKALSSLLLHQKKFPAWKWKKKRRPLLVELYLLLQMPAQGLSLLQKMMQAPQHYGRLSSFRFQKCQLLELSKNAKKNMSCWRELALFYPKQRLEKEAKSAWKRAKQEPKPWTLEEQTIRFYRQQWKNPQQLLKQIPPWVQESFRQKKWQNGYDLLLLQGKLLQRLEKHKEAIAFFQKIKNKTSQISVLQNIYGPWLKSYLESKEYQKAKDLLHEVVEKYPDLPSSPIYAYKVAWAELHQGNFLKAKELFDEFSEGYPYHELVIYSRWFSAWCLYRKGHHYHAKKAFQQWLKKYNKRKHRQKANYWIGRVSEQRNHWKSAIHYYKKTIGYGASEYYGLLADERIKRLQAPLKTFQKSFPVCQESLGVVSKQLSSFNVSLWFPFSQRIRHFSYQDKSLKKLRSLGSKNRKPKDKTKVLSKKVLPPKKKKSLDVLAFLRKMACNPSRNNACKSLRHAQLLFEIGLWQESMNKLYRAKSLLSAQKKEIPSFIRWLNRNHFSDIAIQLVSYGSRKKWFSQLEKQAFLKLYYPIVYEKWVLETAKKNKISPYFIWSIMREESRFRYQVDSWVGAKGLMQIMPSTARKIALSMKLDQYRLKQLYQPQKNIQMGSWYLTQLYRKFGQNYFLASGAYNGGPHRISRWLHKRKNLSSDEFVEEVIFKETRNYIQRVFKTFAIYHSLYEKKKCAIPHHVSVQVKDNISY